MHHLYVIYSKTLNKYYIGESIDVSNRLAHHNQGKQRFTKSGIPWELILIRKFLTRQDALKEEKRLKKCKNRKYLEWYIKNHSLGP